MTPTVTQKRKSKFRQKEINLGCQFKILNAHRVYYGAKFRAPEGDYDLPFKISKHMRISLLGFNIQDASEYKNADHRE
jgi:hypothetical protein